MSADVSLPGASAVTKQWYEIELPIRGCEFSLSDIKTAYRAFQEIVNQEGDDILARLVKPDDKDQAEFDRELAHYRADAFRLTLSIIGSDGSTFYAENADAFDSKNLPNPICRIYFTNINSFRRNSNGNTPNNLFEVWLDFEKRPLIDTAPILSDPRLMIQNWL